MKLAVIGNGYNALSNAAQLMKNHYDVRIVADSTLVPLENADSHYEEYVTEEEIRSVVCDIESAVDGADYIVICDGTSYDMELGNMDTMTLERRIAEVLSLIGRASSASSSGLSDSGAEEAAANKETAAADPAAEDSTAADAPAEKNEAEPVIVLRSDVSIGFTKRIRSKYHADNILYCPDFGREGRAIRDALHPSRVIIGEDSRRAAVYAEILTAGAQDVQVVFTSSDEAEAIKQFANTYLAMRVAFFNELDTFAELHGHNAENLIKGVSLDPRIGDLYNNPSFGYGGRYFIEGTDQLRRSVSDIPQKILNMVEASNETRKDYITERIMEGKPAVIGIYRLSMKTGSKDFRYSAVEGIIRRLQQRGAHVIIYEPQIRLSRFMSCDVIQDIREFIEKSEIIVANRMNEELEEFREKVYTRDIFGNG